MELKILKNGNLQIDDARIIFRNFRGEASKYNNAGDRNFSLVIPDQELADILTNNTNSYGVGWNIKVKDSLDPEDTPRMHMKVKVKFSRKGPNIYLVTGGHRKLLTEDNVGYLDDINIASVRMDIRPYDDIVNGKPFRAAYLASMEVTQDLDRFAAEYEREDEAEEDE